jgi:hypothetical protein
MGTIHDAPGQRKRPRTTSTQPLSLHQRHLAPDKLVEALLIEHIVHLFSRKYEIQH